MTQVVLYQAKNLVNGKRYVGITKQGLATRVYKHLYLARKGKGRRLGAAIRKYGKDAIQFSVLVVCADYKYALISEMAYIGAIKPEYNVTAGGEGVLGLKLSEETRAKLGAVNKGNKYWVGRKHKPETVEKMRQRMIGTVGHWRGRTRPLETIEKFRAAKLANPTRFWLGKKRSPETIAKIVATKAKNKELSLCHK
jgi:group I intron endonuclease